MLVRLSYFVIMLVFDASTLIRIAKVELLDLFLASIELEVAVPVEVARECCGVKKTLDALMIQKALDDARIKVKVVKDKKLVTKLQTDFSLGRGETEAIALPQREGTACRNRRQERNQRLQIAGPWIHDCFGHSRSEPRERFD
jgi:predicted nucleic acid-binding protein